MSSLSNPRIWRGHGGECEPWLRSSAHAHFADKQRKFCEVLSDYRDASTRYANEPNPIKKADMRKPDPYGDFEQRIVDLLGESGRFDKWTGTVRFHVDGQHIGASFFPDCKGFPQAIEFATAAHYVLLSSDSIR